MCFVLSCFKSCLPCCFTQPATRVLQLPPPPSPVLAPAVAPGPVPHISLGNPDQRAESVVSAEALRGRVSQGLPIVSEEPSSSSLSRLSDLERADLAAAAARVAKTISRKKAFGTPLPPALSPLLVRNGRVSSHSLSGEMPSGVPSAVGRPPSPPRPLGAGPGGAAGVRTIPVTDSRLKILYETSARLVAIASDGLTPGSLAEKESKAKEDDEFSDSLLKEAHRKKLLFDVNAKLVALASDGLTRGAPKESKREDDELSDSSESNSLMGSPKQGDAGGAGPIVRSPRVAAAGAPKSESSEEDSPESGSRSSLEINSLIRSPESGEE